MENNTQKYTGGGLGAGAGGGADDSEKAGRGRRDEGPGVHESVCAQRRGEASRGAGRGSVTYIGSRVVARAGARVARSKFCFALVSCYS